MASGLASGRVGFGKETLDATGTVPADDVGRDFAADAAGQHAGVAPAARGIISMTSAPPSRFAIESTDAPRGVDDADSFFVRSPSSPGGMVCADRVDPAAHGDQVLPHARARERGPRRHSGKGAVGHPLIRSRRRRFERLAMHLQALPEELPPQFANRWRQPTFAVLARTASASFTDYSPGSTRTQTVCHRGGTYGRPPSRESAIGERSKRGFFFTGGRYRGNQTCSCGLQIDSQV